eukprot:626748-Hanusia_phi.AAC.2
MQIFGFRRHKNRTVVLLDIKLALPLIILALLLIVYFGSSILSWNRDSSHAKHASGDTFALQNLSPLLWTVDDVETWSRRMEQPGFDDFALVVQKHLLDGKVIVNCQKLLLIFEQMLFTLTGDILTSKLGISSQQGPRGGPLMKD